jgi:hypothetical protein
MVPASSTLMTPAAAFPFAPPAPVAAIRSGWIREVMAKEPHFNVLVECPGLPTLAAFVAIAELCDQTPFLCLLPGSLRLPVDGRRTVLLGDVSQLTRQQQRDLHDWMERGHEATPIVSVSSVRLWPLVESGAFMEDLYYRLNVVTVNAAEPSAAH